MTTQMTEAQARTVELLGTLKSCGAVQSVSGWGEGERRRYYVNLWDASRAFRGDQTTKWYVDVRGVLNHEPGKGTRSNDFSSSVDTFKEFLAANHIEARKVV